MLFLLSAIALAVLYFAGSQLRTLIRRQQSQVRAKGRMTGALRGYVQDEPDFIPAPTPFKGQREASRTA